MAYPRVNGAGDFSPASNFEADWNPWDQEFARMHGLGVSLLQSTAAQGTPAARLAQIDESLAAAAQAGSDLLVTPELFLSSYGPAERIVALAEPQDGPFAKNVAALARQYGVAVVYGYPERTSLGIYNSALALDANGRVLANHRKSVLPPSFEVECFLKGNTSSTFWLNGVCCGLLLCFEVEIPELVRNLALAGVDFVIVPTALSQCWDFIPQNLVPTRAFENGVYVAYANYSGSSKQTDFGGSSCLCGPMGQDVARADRTPALISGRVETEIIAKMRRRLNYLNEVNTNPVAAFR